jgi:hypothetical protein
MRSPTLGYVIAAAIFAVAGVLAGYLVYAAPADGVSFGYWINRPISYGAWLWALGGGLAGLGFRYLTVHR